MSQRDVVTESRRREFLKATGVSAGVLLAGCSEGQEDDEGGTEQGDGDEGTPAGQSGEPVPTLGLTVRSEAEFPTNFHIHRLLLEEWRKLGLSFDVQTMASTPFHDQVLTNHDYEHIFISGWGGATDRLDPQFHLYTTFHSSNAESGSLNITRFQNDEYDELAEAVISTVDSEERQGAVSQALEMLAEEQPITPCVTRPLVDVINTDTVENYISTIEGAFSLWQYLNVETTDNVYATTGRGFYSHLNPFDQPFHLGTVLMSQIYGQPYRFGPEGKIQPGLCDDFELIDDQTVQLHLRDGITFHDGEEITAEDFQYSYRRLSEDDVTTPVRDYLADLDDVEIEDDRTVNILYESSTGTATTLGLTQPYILPKHVMEEWPEPQAEFDPEPEDIVGSGPFEVVDFRAEEQIILDTYEDYWNPAQVERVERPMGEPEPLQRLVQNGEIDSLYGESIPIGNILSLEEESFLDTRQQPNHGFDYVGYHTQTAPTSDRAFRRALGKAAPKQLMNEVIHRDFAEVAHSPITSANSQWHNPDVEKFGGDLEAARDELEQAGYTWDDNDNLLYPE